METRSKDTNFFDDNTDDIRGWPVRGSDGRTIGLVTDLLADVNTDYVAAVVLDNGQQLRAHDLEIADGSLRYMGGVKAAVATAAAGAPAPRKLSSVPAAASEAARPAATAIEPMKPAITSDKDDVVVQLIGEELDVGKRRYDAGGVHLETKIVTEPFNGDVRLAEEHVTFERNKVDRPLSDADAQKLFHDETFEMTAKSQVPIVGKSAQIVEEIVIKKSASDHDEIVRDTLRRMDADIVELHASEALRVAETQPPGVRR